MLDPEPQRSTRRRLLFVAENVTLAQVVRLVALARSLDTERYEVHFACSGFDSVAFHGTSFKRWQIASIEKRECFSKLERGQRIYEVPLLQRYVQQELALFEEVRPDLVIGDFRLSLSVSTAVARLRQLTMINAYWSPYAVREGFPVPDHPIVKLVGVARAARYFPQAIPRVFAHFAAPLNAVRQRYGLSPLGDLLSVLTHGDFTLYPDVPELCPTADLPENHCYLGQVPWAPEVALPEGFAQRGAARPLVYVTLGSSGRLSALKAVLQALSDLPVLALVATAGRIDLPQVPSNVRVVDYVPGDLVARAAAFVVTNGGSSTGYQALAEGRPVLGIPSNMDQYLAMSAIERVGAGILVRAGGVSAGQVRKAMQALLESDVYRARAESIAAAFSRFDCHQRFERVLNRAFATG